MDLSFGFLTSSLLILARITRVKATKKKNSIKLENGLALRILTEASPVACTNTGALSVKTLIPICTVAETIISNAISDGSLGFAFHSNLCPPRNQGILACVPGNLKVPFPRLGIRISNTKPMNRVTSAVNRPKKLGSNASTNL